MLEARQLGRADVEKERVALPSLTLGAPNEGGDVSVHRAMVRDASFVGAVAHHRRRESTLRSLLSDHICSVMRSRMWPSPGCSATAPWPEGGAPPRPASS